MALNNYTALYTPLDIEYAQAMSGPYEDLSERDGDNVCIAGLKDGVITGFWRPMVLFGSPLFQRFTFDRLFKITPRIMWEVWPESVTVSRLCFADVAKATRVMSQRVTRIVDLRATEYAMRKQVRKSYRSLINKTDYEPCEPMDVMEVATILGANHRPKATWDIQQRMDTVCFRRLDGENSAAVMFYYDGPSAYYAHGRGNNVHGMIWASLMELKRRGVRRCEMGDQPDNGTEKQMNIAKLKRGFGGYDEHHMIVRT